MARSIEKDDKIRENENEKRKSCNLSQSASRKQRDIGLNILPRVKPESALINYVQCSSVKRRITRGGGGRVWEVQHIIIDDSMEFLGR